MSGEFPSGVDKNWYLQCFLNPTIKSICSFPIIKTGSGTKVSIPEVIIPEVTYSEKVIDGKITRVI